MINFKIHENKFILYLKNHVCKNQEELINSAAFRKILILHLAHLKKNDSFLLNFLNGKKINNQIVALLIKTLSLLHSMRGDRVKRILKTSKPFFRDKELFNSYVESLYNFWRSFDRFIICNSENDTLDKRPYRTFNSTIENLTHLVLSTYRDIQENITETHPRIYRQVSAGAQIAAIAIPKNDMKLPKIYLKLSSIPIIRQTFMYPPLVIKQTSNKRSGYFERVNKNPIINSKFNETQWLCYPAKVGKLLILVYFHESFYELGFSLSNLFELAKDEDLLKKPDAIYTFGVNKSLPTNKYSSETIFYDDLKNDILYALIPSKKEFGYFGYLKKMILTLHNIKMMKSGHMPFHGALLKITLRDTREVSVLLIGDTGTGKSELLEALREHCKNHIKGIIIIADDMGSLVINSNGTITGRGTETGAFLRLDDLSEGYAFGQIDRSIIMNPGEINARIVIPVTPYSDVIKGTLINFVFYANNHEAVTPETPIIEEFKTPKTALTIFRTGLAASKGTTTLTGLTKSYFANIFGPLQYMEMHEKLAIKYFKKFFKQKIFVGQLRTRLGIKGSERSGPKEAAEELITLLNSSEKP